jgi:COG4 transport protein
LIVHWTSVSSPLYYITALTSLFESIAMIVDQHQPVVEKYYGPGKMRSVVERLLQECDIVVKGIVNAWEEERSMKRKVCRRLPNIIFQCTCSTGVSSLRSQAIRLYQCFPRAIEDLRLPPAPRTAQLIPAISTRYYQNWRE